VEVRLIAPAVRPADLVVIGSHCLGVDWLLSRLAELGYSSKFLAVGSAGGVAAVARGECDLAGIHLLDERTGIYNKLFAPPNAQWRAGYRRRQGIVFRKGDARFEGLGAFPAVENALADANCRMVNRNRGSGTRVLIDALLGSARPDGYAVEARSHHAVAAAIAQHRADWGMAIRNVSEMAGLGFIAHRDEEYDFLVPADRVDRPAVRAFFELLGTASVRVTLASMGLVAVEEGRG
jgi:putative molybdopterin biosynthesis protein